VKSCHFLAEYFFLVAACPRQDKTKESQNKKVPKKVPVKKIAGIL
jgi:hypothetical protein